MMRNNDMEGVNRNIRRRAYEARDKEELIQAIIKLHNEGLSQVDISKKLNISRGTILRWNKETQFMVARTPGEAGKLKCKIYNYDENYFHKIETPNQAYLVGYITGDGTLFDRKKSKRLVLTLAEKDKQLLVDIARELNMLEAVKFRKKNVANEQNKYSLTINSTTMCNDLINLGVTPLKTGQEKWIDFDRDDLQWAYLRGFFDADGHVRPKVRVGFTGNPGMLYSILDFLQSKGIALKVKNLYHKQGCSDIYIYRKSDCKQISENLYLYGSIKLNRKYEKFKIFFDDIV